MRPVRSTGAGCVGSMPVVMPKEGGPVAGPNPMDRGKPGTKRHFATDVCGTPLGLRLRGANRYDGPPMAPLRCHAAVRQAITRRLFAGLVLPVRCPPAVTSASGCPLTLRCPGRCRQIAEPGPALCGGRARAVRGLGVGRNASTGRLRRVQPDWSLPATPDLLRHDKAARSHGCQHLRRSVRRNWAARSVERSALTS